MVLFSRYPLFAASAIGGGASKQAVSITTLRIDKQQLISWFSLAYLSFFQKKGKDLAIISLIVGLFLWMTVSTIEKYGLDYDAGVHMARGEYLLHFYLTGETDYRNLPEDQRCRFQFPDPDYRYTFPYYTFSWYKGGTSLGAISSALTCLVFHKYLGWLDSVDAHNLAGILYAALSILVIYLFALEAFGRKTAIPASLFLALYPTLIGFSHVCIKDLPVFCFVSLTIWCFWKGAVQNRFKLILVSMIFLGMGLVAKMNAAYAVIILGLWIWIPIRRRQGIFRKVTGKFWLTLGLSPLLVILTYMFFAPRIWHREPYNIIENMRRTYQVMIGVKSYVAAKDQKVSPYLLPASGNKKKNRNKKASPSGKNNSGYLLRKLFYAPLHTLVTMPFSILFFALVGVWAVLKKKSGAVGGAGWLALFWAVAPVGFCMLPMIFIHSSIREFLPFVAGVCLLGGIGVERVYSRLAGKYRIAAEKTGPVFLAVATVAVLPVVVSIIEYHPYELAFINRLAGGLAGAQNLRLPASSRKGIPQIGDTRGSSFRNALKWVDKNGEPSSIVIIWATSSRYIQLSRDMQIIPDGWDMGRKNKLKLKKRSFKTVYIIFNRMYWNLIHPLYGYCYKNLSTVYTAKANGAPVSYVYRMSREKFFQRVLPAA